MPGKNRLIECDILYGRERTASIKLRYAIYQQKRVTMRQVFQNFSNIVHVSDYLPVVLFCDRSSRLTRLNSVSSLPRLTKLRRHSPCDCNGVPEP